MSDVNNVGIIGFRIVRESDDKLRAVTHDVGIRDELVLPHEPTGAATSRRASRLPGCSVIWNQE